jgi:hypothetical protein
MKMIIFEARRWVVTQSVTAFAGKTSWCYRFIKRNGLSMSNCTRVAQKMPTQYETKILELQIFLIAARKKSCFELGQTGNMDKVPLLSLLH